MDNTTATHHERRSLRISPAAVETALLVVTAPLLLAAQWLPRPLSWAALALLVAPFVARRMRTRQFTRPAALNLPVAAVALIFLPVALAVSPSPWAITWPRVTTLAWSIALYFTVVNWPTPRRSRHDRRTRLSGPTWAFLALGGVVAIAAPLGLRNVEKLFSLPQTGWLAARLGWEAGLPTNEVAGVLTLYVPFVVALLAGALWTKRRRVALALVPLLALLLVALVLTQSRTGLMTSLVGTALALALGARVSWKWLGVGFAVAALLLLVVALSPLRDWFVFAGANSWQSVIGPRLGIWSQAADAIRDHPVWGMGLGVFGSLTRFVFPLVPPDQASAIEDAHNLYLQTALDFGVVGALWLILLLVIAGSAALGLARVRPSRSLSRLWSAGLLGALLAHALYSLTDAVALGTLGGVALWFVLGLIMNATAARTMDDRAYSPYGRLGPMVVGSSALILLAVLMQGALPVNQAGRLAAQAQLDPAAATPNAAHGLAAARCRAGWYVGLLHHVAGDFDARATAWGELLGCAPEYTHYMAQLAPDDMALARRALDRQPDNAAVYFWLAAMLAPDKPDQAIAVYRDGLALEPGNGWRWLDLARLLDARDDPATLDAYLQVCVNGDPGANGCVRAAVMAEAEGDLDAALRYLRLSNWSEARERAEELERRMGQ